VVAGGAAAAGQAEQPDTAAAPEGITQKEQLQLQQGAAVGVEWQCYFECAWRGRQHFSFRGR